MTFAQMTCRKCEAANPIVYFAPVSVAPFPATCICFDCVKARGWLDIDGNLRAGVVL
jgi:hypothetical protein